MKERKIPLRKCISCQEMLIKKKLIRIVRTPDAQILLDLTGKKPGRGAYICGKLDCFHRIRKSKQLDRSLNTNVSPEIYEQLAQQLASVRHDES
jgi:predicted RNA-binding protein YlxR (DUF448 family)